MTEEIMPVMAVIYARVSSRSQLAKGDGIDSQISRLREFASYQKLDVIEIFTDSVTGEAEERPGMEALIAYVRKRRGLKTFVLIDHISRFARDIVTHRKLRARLDKAGGLLVSPTMQFKDDPDNLFVEGINALQAEHHRHTNAIQTKARMRSRVMNGYYVFYCPVGYEYRAVKGRGKMLFRKEPQASIVTEALEGFAGGRFQTKIEVLRFLETHPDYPKDRQGRVHEQRVTDLLTRPTYAGYVEAPSWGIGLTKGHHPALISFETWQKIQRRLTERANVPARKGLAATFPLRGFVDCDDCGKALTSCFSKGNGGSYGYYMCFNRGCESKGKSIRRDVIEGEFESLLKGMTPSREMFDLASLLFRDWWDHEIRSGQTRRNSLEAELGKIDQSVSRFLDRIVEADTPSVIKAYEDKIAALEREKIVYREKIAQCGRPARSFDANFRTAMEFLANPCNLWDSPRIEDKRAVLKLAFAARPTYARNSGFRTVVTSSPFKLLSAFKGDEEEMARPTGFEPVTPSLEGSCSIRLSYGRVRAP